MRWVRKQKRAGRERKNTEKPQMTHRADFNHLHLTLLTIEKSQMNLIKEDESNIYIYTSIHTYIPSQ